MFGRRGPLASVLAGCHDGFLAIVVFSFLINLLMLTVTIYMLQVYDRVLTSHSGATLVYLTLIAVAALATLSAFDVIRSRILVRIGLWLEQALGPAVFAKSLENALRFHPYRTEALRDVSIVRTFLGGAGVMGLLDAPWAPIYLAFAYMLHPVLGHIALGGSIILFGLALLTNLATQKTLREAGVHASHGLRHAEFAYRNAEVVDAMGMIGALLFRWNRNSTQVLQLQGLASDRAGLISAVAKFVRQLLQIAILGAGAWCVLKHEMSSGGIVAGSVLIGRALAPVEQAIGTWKQVTGVWDSWNRLSALLEQPPLHPVSIELPSPRGELSIENVTYAPPGAQHPVLKGVTLRLRAGEALAIVGPSAAGKSTLARLIVGIGAPQDGAVRLDGADVFAGSRDRLGPFIGYLPQDVELFPGTVSDNIARLVHDAVPKEVIAAAQLAGVHEMILRLPNGYETEIGEQGAMISGGQRQRIGLARALFRRPPLIVLDEPNASLDAAGDAALNDAIRAMKEAGRTVVVIAHKASVIDHVDKIAVINDGRLEMFGERRAVLERLQQRSAPAVNQGQVRALSSGAMA